MLALRGGQRAASWRRACVPGWACLLGLGTQCGPRSGGEFVVFSEPGAHQGSGTVAKNYCAVRVVVMEKAIKSEARIIVIYI